MAQATNYIYDYKAGISIKAGDVVLSNDVITAYGTDSKVVILLTDNVKISINGTDAVAFMRNDVSYIGADKTWTFANDCEVAIAKIVDLAV